MLDQANLNTLYRYGLSLSHHEAIAYDLLQDALEYYLQQTQKIHKPMAYIRQTMRNRYIDQLRRQQCFQEEEWHDTLDNTVEIDFHNLEKIYIERELLDTLWGKLTVLEREMLHLWAVEEYTTQEISEILHTPRGTILSRLHRLRKKLLQYNTRLDAESVELKKVQS